MVVELADKSLDYMIAVSGKLPKNRICDQLIPSVFDESTDGYFINKGMTELTVIGIQIKNCDNPIEIKQLKTNCANEVLDG